MANDTDDLGPDLTQGVTLSDFDDRGMLRGHVGESEVLLTRLGDDVVAVGATCTHYGGPLIDGLVVGATVRCPWHHACFALRTGEAMGAPAIDPLTSWKVERDGDRIVVREPADEAPQKHSDTREDGRRGDVVIIGGGAAGFACAEMLRRRGYTGGVKILSADTNAPYDRPKLSKQFLAGAAGDDDLPLKPEEFFSANDIELHLRTEVTSIDLEGRKVLDASGTSHDFDRLVIATGAEPAELPIPGADGDHVFTLRTFEDSKAIIARANDAQKAVVVGSGFIGLETAASLTQRGVDVHVVTPDSQPLAKVIGGPLSKRVQADHEAHGTVFHTESSLERIDGNEVVLDDGTRLPADLVILGVGVKPRVSVAEDAGLAVDNGVLVDDCLRTSADGVYAAGDIARWKDARSGQDLRVEHWVLAQRHGQHVARNILDGDTPFGDVPFFWSSHHDMKIRYMGHAERWDEMDIDGDVDGLDCVVRFRTDGRTLAVATVGRDLEALEWEADHELDLPTA